MKDAHLLRILGTAAILGGALRIGSAFIPWTPDSAPLEVLYDVIDVLLLFGLMGVYFATRGAIGILGFAAFAIAETGIASIVGPDTTAFGIDTYQSGVLVITAGLTLFAIQLLLTRALPWWASVWWIASTAVGVGATAGGNAGLGFFAGGVLFGLGFIASGVAVFRSATPSSS